MKSEYLTRQTDIIPLDRTGMSIAVIGAGAIGSPVATCLAKMGFEDIQIYDDDEIDEENINCQWYGPRDVTLKKVDRLTETIEGLTGVKTFIFKKRVNKDNWLNSSVDLIICAVDSMEARKEIYEKASLDGTKWFIDPRMSAEEGLIYTVDMRDPERKANYEKTLYTDGEAVEERCTAKATMYCAMMLAGHVAKNVKDIAVEDQFSHTVIWNIKANDYLSFKKENEK